MGELETKIDNTLLDKLRFLPHSLFLALKKLDIGQLQEVRIRANKPIKVLYKNKFLPLLDQTDKKIIIITQAQIAQIVLRAAEFAIYAFNNQLACGYITIQGGIRIGIAGEVVYEGDVVKTQKNFTSLVIRIPHEVIGCAYRAFKSIKTASSIGGANGMTSGIKNKNVLIVAAPGAGKTTLLRDLTRMISNAGSNVLLVDERNEIAACLGGEARLDVGDNTDIINNGLKEYAFGFGIRSLRPDYIITDELATQKDISAAVYTAKCGVGVIASVHASGIDDLKSRQEFKEVFERRVFDRYVVLSSKNGAGTYESILDEELRSISI